MSPSAESQTAVASLTIFIRFYFSFAFLCGPVDNLRIAILALFTDQQQQPPDVAALLQSVSDCLRDNSPMDVGPTPRREPKGMVTRCRSFASACGRGRGRGPDFPNAKTTDKADDDSDTNLIYNWCTKGAPPPPLEGGGDIDVDGTKRARPLPLEGGGINHVDLYDDDDDDDDNTTTVFVVKYDEVKYDKNEQPQPDLPLKTHFQRVGKAVGAVYRRMLSWLENRWRILCATEVPFDLEKDSKVNDFANFISNLASAACGRSEDEDPGRFAGMQPPARANDPCFRAFAPATLLHGGTRTVAANIKLFLARALNKAFRHYLKLRLAKTFVNASFGSGALARFVKAIFDCSFEYRNEAEAFHAAAAGDHGEQPCPTTSRRRSRRSRRRRFRCDFGLASTTERSQMTPRRC
jgi:hypothetical protein